MDGILSEAYKLWSQNQALILILLMIVGWNFPTIAKKLGYKKSNGNGATVDRANGHEFVLRGDCHKSMDSIAVMFHGLETKLDKNTIDLHEKINVNNKDTSEIKGYVKALVEMK